MGAAAVAVREASAASASAQWKGGCVCGKNGFSLVLLLLLLQVKSEYRGLYLEAHLLARLNSRVYREKRVPPPFRLSVSVYISVSVCVCVH